MLITRDHLKQILTNTVHTRKGDTPKLLVSELKINGLEGPLNAALDEFKINTNYRIAAFLANVIIESDHLRTFQEYASGQDYEGRKDLGNKEKGDGMRFKGRGIIQITGRKNYEACGKYFGLDLTSPKGNPRSLADDTNLAMRSGGWFWSVHVKPDLNTYADLGPNAFCETVYRVNGAITAKRTHWPERVKYYQRTLEVLGADVPGEVSSDNHAFHPKHRKHRKRHAPPFKPAVK